MDEIFLLSFLQGIIIDDPKIVISDLFFELTHCILQNENISKNGNNMLKNSKI